MRWIFLSALAWLVLHGGAAGGQLEHDEAPYPNIVKPTSTVGGYGTATGRFSDPYGVLITSDGIMVADCWNHRIQKLSYQGQFKSAIGDAKSLRCPVGIASFKDELIVADRGNHRLVVFAKDGRTKREIGRFGSKQGELNDPLGVATDGKFIFVADSGNNRITVFTIGGSAAGFLDATAFGMSMNEVTSVATNGRDTLYVADTQNNRILSFNYYPREGEVETFYQFNMQWGDYGSVPGSFAEPVGLSYSDGTILVADLVNHRIQAFDENGKYLFTFGRHPVHHHEGDGRVHYPVAVAIDKKLDKAAVCEAFENRCQIFSVSQIAKSVVNVNDSAWWDKYPFFHYGRRLKVALAQDLAIPASADILAMSEPDTHQIVVFDLAGPVPQRLTSFGSLGSNVGELKGPHGVGVNRYGEMFVTDTFNNRVQVFDVARTIEARSLTRTLNQMKSLDQKSLKTLGISVPTIERSVSSALNPPVIRTWGNRGTAPGQFNGPSSGSIAMPMVSATKCNDPDMVEWAFIGDTRNNRIQVFRRDGTPVMQASENGSTIPFIIGGRQGQGPGELNLPTDLIQSRFDCAFYVVEAFNQRVSAFNPKTGEYLFSFGEQGVGEGKFMAPSGIAMDMEGNLYVTDQGAHKVSVWKPERDNSGKITGFLFDRSWGQYGVEDGQFLYPQGIAIDSQNRVYVMDFGNHRGQIYQTTGQFVRNFGLEQLQPVEFTAPVATFQRE